MRIHVDSLNGRHAGEAPSRWEIFRAAWMIWASILAMVFLLSRTVGAEMLMVAASLF
jgi:hypothetical protein